MALTSPPTAVAPFDKGRLAAGITASATSLTVSPIYKTVAGVRTKQGINTTSGCAIISAGDFTELVTYTGVSVDSTTKISTVTGLTRGRDPTATTSSASFASGTGRIWAKGAKFTVVADATYFQSGVFTNVANTFTANQTLATTNELRFADSATAIWDDGTSLSFKDSTTATKTLAQLAAAAGTDEKTKVSINDTTGDYLLNKLVAGDGITLTEVNDAGDEDISIAAANTVATGHTGLATITTGGLLVGAGTSNMTIIGPGTTGQVPVSNGTTIAMATVPSFDKTVFSSGVTSATLTNPTSETNYATYTYTIPANDLVAGVVYEFRIIGQCNIGTAGDFTFAVRLGSSGADAATWTAAVAASGVFTVLGSITGTAAAGSSVAVKCGGLFTQQSGSTNFRGVSVYAVSPSTYATDGTLALHFSALFGTSNGGNNTFIDSGYITRKFTTAS